MKQQTLGGSFTVEGKSLHSGVKSVATFHPAPDNHGYKFKRTDLEGEPVIDAVAENIVDIARSTILGKGPAQVSTVEHALAALYALGVDNCLIEVNCAEMPILDGSAKEYVKKIEEVGIVEQKEDKDYYIIKQNHILSYHIPNNSHLFNYIRFGTLFMT